MSQNQEIIESKLCAYIDGELDAEGRTEIEKHLDANPQHRRLLESLKATRDLIKWLPREPAPPELAETLNGQLERSVLLDFDERSLNRNIWPRFLTAAAIVLLTAGLGAAVYFTLPKGQKNATPYAMRSNESQSPMPEATVPEPAADVTKSDDTLVAAASMPKAANARVLAAKIAADKTPNPELDRLASNVSQNQAAIVAVANGVGPAQNAGPPIPSNAIVMLVHANSTELATRDVTTYLESQKIQWKNAPFSAGLDQNTTQPAGAVADLKGDSGSLRERVSNRDAGQIYSTAPTTRTAMLARSSMAVEGNSSQNSNFYVARMSRQQAIDLSNSVQQGVSQKAELKELGLATGNPEWLNRMAMPPTTAPAGIVPGASYPLLVPATGPTTRPAYGAFGGAMGFGQPTTQSGADGAAELAAMTPSADAPVDVVIVVQPDAIAASTQPSALAQTQPAATQPASTQPASTSQPSTN